MDSSVLIIMLCAFLSVMTLVLAVTGLWQQRQKNRTVDPAAIARIPVLFRMFAREIALFNPLATACFNRDNPAGKKLQNDLLAADMELSDTQVRAAQLFCCLLGAILCFLFTLFLSTQRLYAAAALCLGAAFGFFYPLIQVEKAAERRKEQIAKALPFCIDLITVSTQAGQDFGAALRHLVNSGFKGPLITEFAVMLRQTELGKSRVEALNSMSSRVQLEEFRSLVTAVSQSAELGSSLTQTLKMQAEEIRRARFHRAERQAARAPSIMLIPMALFILPAVFIIIFTPVIIRVLDSGVPLGG